MDLTRTPEKLHYCDLTSREARETLQRNAISGYLFRMAFQKLKSPGWIQTHGPHMYVIDTLTDRGARITYCAPYEDGWEIKVSRRTGTALLDELHELGGYYIDDIVILD